MCLDLVARDVDTRAVLLSGASKAFVRPFARCWLTGLDLHAALNIFAADSDAWPHVLPLLAYYSHSPEAQDVARRALKIRMFGKAWQDAFSSMATRCYIRSLEVYLEIANGIQ